MDKTTEETIKAVSVAGILGIMTATIRAVLAKGETVNQKMRTFFAGVFLAAFAGYLLNQTELSSFWKGLIEGSCGAFVSTLWPIFELGAKKFFQKKVDNVSDEN